MHRLAITLFVAMAFAGCLDDTPLGQADDAEHFELGKNTFPVALLDLQPGDVLNASLVRDQGKGKQPDTCYIAADLMTHYIMWAVWNRTGMTTYGIEPFTSIDQERHDVSLALPPDPPYLFYHDSSACGNWITEIDLPAHRVKPTTRVPAPYTGEGQILVLETVELDLAPVIKAGNTSGRLTFPMHGEWLRIMVGFEKVDPSVPVTGSFKLYEDWMDPETEYNRMFLYERGGGRERLQNHYHFAFPGDLVMEVEMDVPLPVDVTFTPTQVAVHKFTPAIADYGFQYPFTTYVSCIDGTADCVS